MAQASLEDIFDLEEWSEYIGSVLGLAGNPELIEAFNYNNTAQLTVGGFLSLIDAAEAALLSIDWQSLIAQLDALLNDPVYGANISEAQREQISEALGQIDESDIIEGFNLIRNEFDGVAPSTLVVDALDLLSSATAGNGPDRVVGNEGDDVLSLGGGNDEFLPGTSDVGNDTVSGGKGADTIVGGAGDDSLSGDSGSDRLIGSGGADSLLGGARNDVLRGGSGADMLHGGSGRDRLEGGGGNDVLRGQGGADRFIFKGNFGDDEITDFRTAGRREKIDLRKVDEISSFDDLTSNHMSEDSDGNAVISDDRGNTITLINVSIGDLSVNDFLL